MKLLLGFLFIILKTRLLVLVFLAGLILSFGWLWFSEATSPVLVDSESTQIFIVKKGENIRQIGQRLKAQELIRSPLAFYLVTRKENLAKQIQAGDFRLSPSMNTKQVAQELTHGTLDIWITIPEGWRNGQIAMLLNKELGIDKTEFLKLAQEGYMFPDTYLIPRHASSSSVVRILRNNFTQKVGTNITKDILILASIVEREAKKDQDRAKIAGVLKNRLDIGMPLQADATLQYIKGYDEESGSWWAPPTAEDKMLDSPYNTYANPGLPLGPISNPGLSAIKAAANPEKSNFLYYLSEEDGTTHYAETLEEHNQNIQKYLR